MMPRRIGEAPGEVPQSLIGGFPGTPRTICRVRWTQDQWTQNLPKQRSRLKDLFRELLQRQAEHIRLMTFAAASRAIPDAFIHAIHPTHSQGHWRHVLIAHSFARISFQIYCLQKKHIREACNFAMLFI